MSKHKQIDKTVIYLNENKIKYLTLSKNNNGFYIKNYDSAELEEGVIVRGEVLKAEFLSKILDKISKKIDVKSVDLILPHEYFLFDLHEIEKTKKNSSNKVLKQYLKENKKNISWAGTHSFEYDLFNEEDKIKALFRALPNAINSSYQHVFEKSKIKINSVQSDMVSFSNLLRKDGRLIQIFVDVDHTFLLEYKNGIFESDKKFNLSYKKLLDIIKKNINVSDVEAEKILSKYGVLRTHKDDAVFKSTVRNMRQLLVFLREITLEDKSPIYIHFSSKPIPGFSDKIRKELRVDVHDLCALCCSKYLFQDVLSLHKKDSYEYEPLITRALAVFKDK